MTDDIQALRADVAFLKSLATDEGSIPGIVGAHFVAAGVIYGLPAIFAWAIFRRLVDVPQAIAAGMGLWPTVVYIPVMLLIFLRTPKPKPGAAQGRAMVVGWSGVGLVTLTMLAVIFIAGARLHESQMWQVWTSICFALWGAAWWVVAVLRRSKGWLLVALGSLANAVVNACLVSTPEEILGCGVGILLWLAGPGFWIMFHDRSRVAG